MSNYILDKLKFFNLEKLEKIFFALFLLSIPLQTRLSFVTPQTYLNGQFNEYATFFIYLSDIFLITTFFLYFVNRLTKTKDFSITQIRFYAPPHLIPMVFLAGFFLWSILSAKWAEYPNMALFQSLKLAELILLVLYVKSRLLWFGLNKAFALIFITGNFQAIIGIGQYLTQKSLGLKILGESILAPNLDNVAKIVVDGERTIRAYGTFPHPNVFAGFLILSISCGFWLFFSARIKEKIKIVSRLPTIADKILALLKGKNTIVSRETIYDKAKEGKTILQILLTIGIVIQLFAFILTFSRIAWLTMVLVIPVFGFWGLKMLYLKEKIKIVSRLPAIADKILALLKGKNTIVSRETIYDKAKEGKTILILIAVLLIISALWPQINSRTIDAGNNYKQAIDYRVLYNDIAIKIIKDRPITGIGNGNFTLKMKDYSPVPLEWWQYQPAHNIYLLIASELEIIGLILFLFFIFSVLKVVYSSQNENYGFHPPIFLLKLFHVKQLINYALNKPNKSIDEKISAGKRETILASIKEDEAVLLNRLIFVVFIGFLFIGLFDHYFWTLQQGRLTFWLVIGVLIALSGLNGLKKED